MGCWGITAFESDAGLDAVICIRKHLPDDGKLVLKDVLEALKGDGWNQPPGISECASHSSPMALAEIMIKFLDGNFDGLDHDEEWAKDDKKFKDLVSFQADRESVQWIRDYLKNTLDYAVQEASMHSDNCKRWNGWFLKKDWLEWQAHMQKLVYRLDGILLTGEEAIELVKPQAPEQGVGMKM